MTTISDNRLPEINQDTILVFDKDGVIFHSEDFKFEYFLSLFDQFTAHEEAIKEYLVGSGGTPRKIRFQKICRDIIGIENPEAFVDSILEKSFDVTSNAILEMPFVEGAREFILKYPNNLKFVCSGSTQDEVDNHLKANKIDDQFVQAFGGVADKSVVLGKIKKEYGSDMLYFGDTMVDHNAATKAAIPFIGLRTSKYHDPFEHLEISKVHSFNELL